MRVRFALIVIIMLGMGSLTGVSAQDVKIDESSIRLVDPLPESATDPVATPIEVSVPAPVVVDANEPTAISKLVNELMNVLIPAFITLIGLLATFILNWIRKKFKLNVSDHQISSWSTVAEKAAHRAAEWARNKSKQMTDGKKVPGPEVLDVAVDWAVEMGKAFKLPDIGREKLIGLIESRLHVKRGTEI